MAWSLVLVALILVIGAVSAVIIWTLAQDGTDTTGDEARFAPIETQRATATSTKAPATATPVLAPTSPAPAPTLTQLACDLEDLNEALTAVVRIETGMGSGSGFFIAPGVIATNRHVVEGGAVVLVALADGTLLVGSVGAVSESRDLAIVLVPVSAGVVGLDWGNSQSLLVAEEVFAIGFPLGTFGPPVLTKGVVSRVYEAIDGVTYVQTDAALNPGNSGGPLLDRCGKVVGIVTFKVRDAEGLALAQAESSVLSEIFVLAQQAGAARPSAENSRRPMDGTSANLRSFASTVLAELLVRESDVWAESVAGNTRLLAIKGYPCGAVVWCQQVFFFRESPAGTFEYVGTDTFSPSRNVLDVELAGAGTFAVRYAVYFEADPNCCPTGPTVTVHYTHNGVAFDADRTPPPANYVEPGMPP